MGFQRVDTQEQTQTVNGHLSCDPGENKGYQCIQRLKTNRDNYSTSKLWTRLKTFWSASCETARQRNLMSNMWTQFQNITWQPICETVPKQYFNVQYVNTFQNCLKPFQSSSNKSRTVSPNLVTALCWDSFKCNIIYLCFMLFLLYIHIYIYIYISLLGGLLHV